MLKPLLYEIEPFTFTKPEGENRERRLREDNTCFVEAAINSSPIDDTTIRSPEDSTHTSRRGCRGGESLRKNRAKRKATMVTNDTTKLNSSAAASATHEGKAPTVHKSKVTLLQHVPAPVNNDANRGEKHVSASLFPPASSNLEGVVGNALPQHVRTCTCTCKQ